MIPRRYALPARAAVYALVGVLTFITQPPGATAVPAQLAGYALAGAGLLIRELLQLLPAGSAAARSGARALPLILGVIAVGSGSAAGAGLNENNCAIMLTGLAAIEASVCCEPRVAWAVTGAGILAFEANWLIYPDTYAQLSTFLLQPLGPVTALLLVRIARARRAQAEQAAALLARTRELQEQQRIADVLDERTRIAREIHDVLAHSLGALSIQIQTARALLTDQRDSDRAVEILLTAQRLAAEGLTETRRAVHALRADLRPLADELARAADSHRERYQVGVSFGVEGAARPLAAEATVALLRVAQEALVNAAKHAAGQDVAVRLDYGDRDLRLTVVNDLLPHRASAPCADGAHAGGYGLTGMGERLRLLNGTLTAGPCASRWAVTATLPLSAAAQPQEAIA